MRGSKKLDARGVIYRITNTVNGKIYIGLTREIRLCERWAGHVQAAERGATAAISSAIRKYGRDAFAMEWIASPIDGADLGYLEALLIEQEQSHASAGRGYNLSSGGESAFTRTISAAGRKSLAKSRNRPDWIAANSARQLERMRSDEGKAHHALMIERARAASAKLSESRRAYALSAEGNAQIKAASRLGAESARRVKSHPIFIDGVRYDSIAEAARVLEMEASLIRYRLKSPGFPGWMKESHALNTLHNDGAAG
jgi:group I intron endonuclease